MADDRIKRGSTGDDVVDRGSSWKALVIALAPIPLALLITWALGASPPWRPRPAPPAPVEGHGPR